VNFFESQAQARRQSRHLILLFVLAVLIIVGILNVAIGYSVLLFLSIFRDNPPAGLNDMHPAIFYSVSLVTLLFIGYNSLQRMRQLRQGGPAVARLVDARRVTRTTQHHLEKRLLNVVEEMAIAAGTPVPRIYIMDHERGINAFAAGYSDSNAIIVVTRGALFCLDRAELQAVIAHEFSHILNGDILLNIRLMGVLHGLTAVGALGSYLIRNVSSSVQHHTDIRGVVISWFFGAILMIIGYLGLFFARLIKTAVSRRREILADAAAVQFTRLSAGLVGALNKIRGQLFGSQLAGRHAEALSHMLFSDGFRVGLLPDLLQTHPPMEQRILHIDPTFDLSTPLPNVEVPPPIEIEQARQQQTSANRQKEQEAAARQFETIEYKNVNTPAGIIESIGHPHSEHLAYAVALHDSVPEVMLNALGDRNWAQAIVFALMLDTDEQARTHQHEILQRHAPLGLITKIIDAYGWITGLGSEYHLPLLYLALPALHDLSTKARQDFLGTLERVINADQVVTLREYVFDTILTSRLSEDEPGIVRFHTVQDVMPDCAIILSLLCHAGKMAESEKPAAFANGMMKLGLTSSRVLDKSMITLQDVQQALAHLKSLHPLLKFRVLDACTGTIFTNKDVSCSEAEVLRAVAEAMACPMPPLLPGKLVKSGIPGSPTLGTPAAVS
jgi:Zn-dependent protease with chaperone function